MTVTVYLRSFSVDGSLSRPRKEWGKSHSVVSIPAVAHYKSALTTLIGEVLADPDLAHQDVFRRMLQAGLQDLVDAEATTKIGAVLQEQHDEWSYGERRYFST